MQPSIIEFKLSTEWIWKSGKLMAYWTEGARLQFSRSSPRLHISPKTTQACWQLPRPRSRIWLLANTQGFSVPAPNLQQLFAAATPEGAACSPDDSTSCDADSRPFNILGHEPSHNAICWSHVCQPLRSLWMGLPMGSLIQNQDINKHSVYTRDFHSIPW